MNSLQIKSVNLVCEAPLLCDVDLLVPRGRGTSTLGLDWIQPAPGRQEVMEPAADRSQATLLNLLQQG